MAFNPIAAGATGFIARLTLATGMDERSALRVVEGFVAAAGDDAAVVDGMAVAVDMLHADTDLPGGITPYTTGWRAVSVALSDLAAVGAVPAATLSVYSPPRYEADRLEAYLRGATDASEAVDARYVGGDLDITEELTVVGVALGRVDEPVGRSGAVPGDAVVVTGSLGRGAVAMDRFEAGEDEAANALFRIEPRIDAGVRLAEVATAMIDSSDGLARSLHLLAEASGCGIEIEADRIPYHEGLDEDRRREGGLFWGEDFELVATLDPDALGSLPLDVPVTRIGTVTDAGVTIDGDPLPDRGYDHAPP